MFEAAELGRKIEKKHYKSEVPALRAELLQTQFALSQTRTPVYVIVSGLNAAGRGEVVNALNEWLDPRGMETISLDKPTDEERERPYFWRFWRCMPARGRIGLFFGAWYVQPIENWLKQTDRDDYAAFDAALEQVRRLENMLAADGALILKFWLHLPMDEQHKRLKKLEKDPHTKRLVSKQDWHQAEQYAQYVHIAERMLRHTDSAQAPWILVEATDKRYRDLTVARTVLQTLQKHLANQAASTTTEPTVVERASRADAPVMTDDAHLTVLDTVDLTQQLSDEDYHEQLTHYQGKLHQLTWAAQQAKISSVVVMEGWDAAGKGGCLRRITQAMDARLYRVISTAAPTDEEKAQHYLWRFWRHIPRDGTVTLYDRSWYGRVLVERVEGFAHEEEWLRAYAEINHFEDQLQQHGSLVLKFWLHIDADEQLRRFHEREQVPYKQHKITEEDWRNREKWDDYRFAVNDMVARTSTTHAPWTLVAANNKYFARIQVLQTLCERLENRLKQK